MKKIKTFTLIEMLIVIVIIGILAAALIPRLQSVQSRARDTKRKVDLRNIYNANEIYFTDNGRYVVAGTCADNTTCASWSTDSSWAYVITWFSSVLTTLPVDPINKWTAYSAATWNYVYTYWYLYNAANNSAGNWWTYDLFTVLENSNDPDRCELKLYRFARDLQGFCGGSNPYQPYERKKNIYDLSPNVPNQ